MSRAFIALGGNLGAVEARLLAVMAELDELPRTRLLRASSLYRSAPVGYAEQPDFVNAVAMVDTGLSSGELMRALLAMENRHGRVRSVRNGPRTLDLDLLLYGEETRDEGFLILPHPRMHVRAFVLAPLLEIAPDQEIPGRGGASECYSACDDQADVVRIDGSGFDRGYLALRNLGRGMVPVTGLPIPLSAFAENA